MRGGWPEGSMLRLPSSSWKLETPLVEGVVRRGGTRGTTVVSVSSSGSTLGRTEAMEVVVKNTVVSSSRIL